MNRRKLNKMVDNAVDEIYLLEIMTSYDNIALHEALDNFMRLQELRRRINDQGKQKYKIKKKEK